MSEEKYNIDEYPIEEELEEFMKFNKEQVKIIEDLQQKVEQLEKENILLKEANNYHQEVIESMKEPENVHHYHLENIKLRAKNKQLENIRKEAIECIETGSIEINTKEYGNLTVINSDDLLNILNKGE